MSRPTQKEIDVFLDYIDKAYANGKISSGLYELLITKLIAHQVRTDIIDKFVPRFKKIEKRFNDYFKGYQC